MFLLRGALNPIICNLKWKVLNPNSIPKRFNFLNSKKILKISIVPHRTYYWGGLSKKPNELLFKKTDDIPDGFNLIYRTETDRYIKWGYCLAWIASVLFSGALLLKFDLRMDELFVLSPKHKNFNEITVYITAFALFFIAIHTFMRQVPLRIYNMPLQKKYIFVFNGTIPLTLRKEMCNKGEVSKLNISEMLSNIMPWNQSAYLLNDSQKVLLFEDSFRRPADLHILLGAQDDLDIE